MCVYDPDERIGRLSVTRPQAPCAGAYLYTVWLCRYVMPSSRAQCTEPSLRMHVSLVSRRTGPLDVQAYRPFVGCIPTRPVHCPN